MRESWRLRVSSSRLCSSRNKSTRWQHAPKRWLRNWRRWTPAVNPHKQPWPHGALPRQTRMPSAIEPQRLWHPRVRRTKSLIAKSRGSKQTLKRLAAASSRQSIPRRRCGIRWSTPHRRAIGCSKSCPSCRLKATISGLKTTVRRRIAKPHHAVCCRRMRRWKRRGSPGPHASPNWPPRASSTNGAREWCDRANTSLRGSTRG